MQIKYLGHSAFEIETNGKKILIDPFLIMSPNYNPQGVVDIFVTHGHGDHLGSAIEISKKTGAPIVHTYHTMYEDYMYLVTKGHFDKVSREFVRKTVKTFLDKTCNQVIVPTEKVYKMLKDEYKVEKDIHII